MSTSANVIIYDIRNANGVVVGRHRQNIMCEFRLDEFAVYSPARNYTIIGHGEDEDGGRWEGDTVNLEDFIASRVGRPLKFPPAPTRPKPQQIKTLADLWLAASNRLSVTHTPNDVGAGKSMPAAFLINMSGTVILHKLQKGLYVYSPAKKCKKKFWQYD